MTKSQPFMVFRDEPQANGTVALQTAVDITPTDNARLRVVARGWTPGRIVGIGAAR